MHSREKHKIRAIEKEIGKQFVEGTIPSPKDICTKQLYKVMDQIDKTDIDEEQIAPFMADINRRFEYIEKEEDLIRLITNIQDAVNPPSTVVAVITASPSAKA